MTWEFLEEQMGRLKGLKFPPADMTTHWEALKDLPPAILEAAVTRAQKTRTEFPTPVELRQDADLVKHHVDTLAPSEDRGIDLETPVEYAVPHTGIVVSVTREWRYDCARCHDSGWASWWCGASGPTKVPWIVDRQCGRPGVHGSHEWVGRCACWETNLTLIRKRAAQRQYAAEKAGKAA